MAQQNSIANKSSELTIDPGASGDSFVQFDINTTSEFKIGVDDTASDAFKISQGSALGTNDTFIMTAAGERTMPLQPAFNAFLGTTDTDETGDGTDFQIGSGNALTERFDQNSDFNTDGTFTAPVTGQYQLNFMILYLGLDGAHDPGVQLVTSNETYFYGESSNPSAGNFPMAFSMITDMDESDTAVFIADVTGGAKVVDIFGSSATPRTVISGFLVC